MKNVQAVLESANDPLPPNSGEMLENAQRTTDFLKSLSHPARLVILCRLAEGSASVGELEDFLQLPQSAVSKQLARLREDGLVDCTRDGRSITYSLLDEKARVIISTLYQEFCA
ncbi:biofilm growth-associated repressor [mine drainage metagenome]|uniref:Biofilm growth-associated repressor n=1 Tax=mine drainage metagenome TaxID=410659 RepID=A0A1J5QHI7_9ZZZZ